MIDKYRIFNDALRWSYLLKEVGWPLSPIWWLFRSHRNSRLPPCSYCWQATTKRLIKSATCGPSRSRQIAPRKIIYEIACVYSPNRWISLQYMWPQKSVGKTFISPRTCNMSQVWSERPISRNYLYSRTDSGIRNQYASLQLESA